MPFQFYHMIPTQLPEMVWHDEEAEFGVRISFRAAQPEKKRPLPYILVESNYEKNVHMATIKIYEYIMRVMTELLEKCETSKQEKEKVEKKKTKYWAEDYGHKHYMSIGTCI